MVAEVDAEGKTLIEYCKNSCLSVNLPFINVTLNLR